MDCLDGELSIVITDDDQIASLNHQYLNRQGPTNVIAFAMQEGPFTQVAPHLLGDVIISIDTAYKEAQDAGITLHQRFTELLIHGILHLFGYDHEQSYQQEQLMDEKSKSLLNILI